MGNDPRRRSVYHRQLWARSEAAGGPDSPGTIRKPEPWSSPSEAWFRSTRQVKDDLTDVVVSNEDVVQVKVDPTNPKLLQLTGRTTGLAQMTLSFKTTPKRTYDIVVQPDLNLLRNIIKRTVPTAAGRGIARHRPRDHHQRLRDQPAGRGHGSPAGDQRRWR